MPTSRPTHAGSPKSHGLYTRCKLQLLRKYCIAINYKDKLNNSSEIDRKRDHIKSLLVVIILNLNIIILTQRKRVTTVIRKYKLSSMCQTAP